jgi:spermidine/putrescine transport system substrate-binding protein
MRKRILLVLLLALLVPVMVLAQEAEEVEPWICPEGFEGQELHIWNWSTYIAENTEPDFEEACGVEIIYDIFDSNETMLARIRQGNPGYDIVVPSGSTVATMVREELLIPLNKDLIPNIENLNPALMDQAYDPGNVYTVPYQWGTVGIGYNTEVFPDGITTWEQLWNHDGSVAWLDDRRVMFGVALLTLGYDPNTSDADEINEARDFLIERGGNVVAVAADDGQELLARGDVDATIEYNGDIVQLAIDCECETYAYSLPEEAVNVWIDNLAIPADAPNPTLANVFIDYILHPQVGADISNYTAYASPNLAAFELGLIDETMADNPAVYPDTENIENLFTIIEADAETEQAYNDAWDELLIFLGQ